MSNNANNYFKNVVLCPLITAALCGTLVNDAQAKNKEDVTFSSGFMKFYEHNMDLTQFNGVEKILPGNYKMDVYRNDEKIDSWNVTFIAAKNAQGVNACITPEMIIRFDVDLNRLPENWKATSCIILPELITGATVAYDQENEKLNVTIPQAALLNIPEGYINPELWDNGVPALMASYNMSASSNRDRAIGESSNYLYGNLQTALSLGAWRFVTYDVASSSSDGNSQGVEHIQAYARRAIAPLSSEMTVGDLSTTGEFFNTTALRGARLATDDRMLPDSVRSYAPVVRGIANSNATVTIRQAGNILYEKSVPPGEFTISDLYATGYNGDLDVTVKETDGKTTHFTVPYSSVPQLLREGYSRYALTAGEVRNTGLKTSPMLWEGTWQYGLWNNVTPYIGGQTALKGDYASLMAGFAINTRFGAVGIDVSRSFTQLEKPVIEGDKEACHSVCEMSMRISLSKNLPDTGTSFSLVGYRYSSPDYYSLSDAIDIKRASEFNQDRYYPERYRERLEANINQALPEGYGSFYINGFLGNVWNDKLAREERSNVVLGYNNQWGTINWGISFSRTNNDDGKHEDTLYLNLSMPLGHRYEKRARLGANFSYNSNEANVRTSLNGSAGERSQLGFGGYYSQSNNAESNIGMNLNYTGDSAAGGVAYSQTRDNFMGSVNLSGGVVAHKGGVNFTPTLSDTIGIVEAKGAEGSYIYPDSHGVIKSNGYGVVSYLNPYKYNDLYVDPKGTSMGIDIEDTHKKIVPSAGAAVMIKVDTQKEQQLFMRLINATNEPIPYGANIENKHGERVAMVGQSGLAMLDISPGNNQWIVRWQKNKTQNHCVASYNNSDDSQNNHNEKLNTQAQTVLCKK